MTMSSDMAQAIEKAHYRNQQGMFFSEMKVIDGAVLLYSDIIDDFFWNYAAQVNITEGRVEELIQEVITFYREKKRLPSVYVTPFSKPNKTSKCLENHGFKVELRDAWMIYEKEPPAIGKPKALTIEEVKSNQQMEIFVKVFYEAYGGASPEEPYGELAATYGEAIRLSCRNPSKETNVINYIGFVGEKPVGIGTLISSNGFGGIYNVGTSSDSRREGIGSAISLRAVEDSMKQRNTVTYLMTEEGSYVEELYRKLGFCTEFVGEGYVLSE
ncbi:GNAT family N-acetyltransferase [bacterium]|nr:GNAT family N-acetyltransferase [bacterium]